MKKETVIRQNRCDQEMNLFLFGCFFIFMAIQLVVGNANMSKRLEQFSRILSLVFVPGFMFRLGYCFKRIAKSEAAEEAKQRIIKEAGRYYIFYFAVTYLYALYQKDQAWNVILAKILSFRTIPAVSSVFFSMALILVISWICYDSLTSVSAKTKRLIVLGAVCLTGSFLYTGGELYPIMAAFIGSSKEAAAPVIPYAAYFVLGMFFEEYKPGFQWKYALSALAVTGVSVFLYRTPLKDLCRITIALFPVYAIYVLSEGMSELTLRFRPVRFVCEFIEGIFCGYTVLLFLIIYSGRFPGGSGKLAVLYAVGAAAAVIAGIAGVWLFNKVYSAGAEYFCTKVKHKTAVYFSVYTVVFAFLLFLVFIDFLRYDKTLLWKKDAVTQYYPKAIYVANYIRELFANILSGNFRLPMYDFSLGLGGEITYSLEPLYFLFPLLGAEHVEFTYNLLILLRFYFSGIAASVLFLYFKKDYFTTFIASVVYVFCGFSLYGGARHFMFMVPMILLPLLVIAVEEIIRHKKWYLCTILVALSLFSNYYYLYMTTIGMVIYFFVRFYCQQDKEKRSFKNLMANVFITGGSYLLGVAMSCIVLVTTFGLYVGSGRSGDAFIKTPSLIFYKDSWLVRCFLSFLTTANSPGDWLKLGFLPIAYLAIVLLFLRKGRKELKILSVISVVMMAFPIVGFVFSGFSAVNNRWCYLMSMLVAFIVAECLPGLFRMDRREIRICAVSVGVYTFLSFFGDVLNNYYTKLAAVCLIVTFFVVLICQEEVKALKKYSKQALMILLTFAMVLHSGHSLFGAGGAVDEYVKPGEAHKLSTSTPTTAVRELEDESFYRVSVPKLPYYTIGSSMITEYNGNYTFNSTLNKSITEYLEKMASTSYTTTQLYGMDNRAFMNALASIKYYAYYNEPACTLPYGYEPVLLTESNNKQTTVCENVNALPLGYTYDTVISEEELETYDYLERQEIMMQTAVLAEEDRPASLDKPEVKNLKTSVEELELERVEEQGIHLTDTSMLASDQTVGEDGKMEVTLHFESKPNSETYLVLENAVLEGNMSEQRVRLDMLTEGYKVDYDFRADDDRYRSGQEDFVFNLGYHEEVIHTCTIVMDRKDEIKFESLKLYSQSMEHLEEYSDARKENILENAVLDTNKVTGTISLEEEKLLVLSIPYQNGWTAYVNGEPAELIRTNYMYMGLPLSAGEHTIELEFAIPGVKYALVIMPGAVVLFLVLCLVSVIRKKVRTKSENQEKTQKE